MKMYFRLLVVPALVAGLQTASAGDITGKGTLKGTPPPENQIDVSTNPDCTKKHADQAVMPRPHVAGADKGLAGVIVSLKGMDGKSTGASAPAATLDQKGCEYWPYVT